MQAKMIEPRLKVDRIRRRNPDGRPIARLTPHPQRSQTLLRERKFQFVQDGRQQFLWVVCPRQIRLCQPRTQRFIGQPPTPDRGEDDDCGSFVI
jgi:hypothetical protein